jgi:hypothetical protein
LERGGLAPLLLLFRPPAFISELFLWELDSNPGVYEERMVVPVGIIKPLDTESFKAAM